MGFKVSDKIYSEVQKILNADGQAGINSDKEYYQLSGLLAGAKRDDDKEYIEGFMIEWQGRKNAAFPPNDNKNADEAKPTEKNESQPTKTETTPPVKDDVNPELETKPPVKEEEGGKPGGHWTKPPVENDVNTPVNKKPAGTASKGTNVTNANHNVYQNGGNNFHFGPDATVIVGTDAPFNIGEKVPVNEEDNTTVPPTPEKPENKDKKELKDLSPREIKAARDNGKRVADKLFGHTSNNEQSDIQDIINNKVNPDNIIEFIRGFEEVLKDERKAEWFESAYSLLKGMTVDHVFEQLLTENNFPEKEKMMRKLAKDLQVHIKAKYGDNISQEDAKEIPVTLLEHAFDENDARKLDNIALRELRKKH